MRFAGSTDVALDLAASPLDRSKHSPDASYIHNLAKYPGLVIEISHSQKTKDLPRIADNYICGSAGNIKMVLGLDLPYGTNSKVAKAYIWRPKLTPFDDDDGISYELSSQLVYKHVSNISLPRSGRPM